MIYMGDEISRKIDDSQRPEDSISYPDQQPSYYSTFTEEHYPDYDYQDCCSGN